MMTTIGALSSSEGPSYRIRPCGVDELNGVAMMVTPELQCAGKRSSFWFAAVSGPRKTWPAVVSDKSRKKKFCLRNHDDWGAVIQVVQGWTGTAGQLSVSSSDDDEPVHALTHSLDVSAAGLLTALAPVVRILGDGAALGTFLGVRPSLSHGWCRHPLTAGPQSCQLNRIRRGLWAVDATALDAVAQVMHQMEAQSTPESWGPKETQPGSIPRQ